MRNWLGHHAPAVGAVAAVVGVMFTVWFNTFAVRDARKSTDLKNYNELMKTLADAERRVKEAAPQNRQWELTELMNTLESFAEFYNRKLTGKASRAFIETALIERIAWLETVPEVASTLRAMKTGETTFAELLVFRKKHGRKIDRRRDAYLGIRPGSSEGPQE